MPRKSLTLKQQRFVSAYVQHGNGTRAAKEAGYSEDAAAETAHANLRKAHILEAVEKANERAARAAGLDENWVLDRLIRNAEAAADAEQYAPSTKAAELLAKYLNLNGIAGDKLKMGFTDGNVSFVMQLGSDDNDDE